MTARVNMHDVARLAGVSQRTVSNVVNNLPQVAPATRERVQRAIQTLDYRPHVTAQSLRGGRTGIVGLALPEISGPYFAELAGLVQQHARDEGVTLLIDETGRTREGELFVLDRYRSNLIDGLILHPVTLTAQELVAAELDVPIVLLGEHLAGTDLLHVSIDNVAAAREATEHLLACGRRRILALGVMALGIATPEAGYGPALQRQQGYREAMGAAGLPVDAELVPETGVWSRARGYELAEQVAATRPRVDGVFCFNDQLALGLLRGLADLGVAVPDDIAVVGWDDIDDAAYSIPRLSSVAPDKRAIARVAIDGVLHPAGSATAPQIGYALRVRESSG